VRGAGAVGAGLRWGGGSPDPGVALEDGGAPARRDAARLVRRGGELRSRGLHAEALDAFSRAAELDADSADAHAGRAGELSALGRHSEALGAYDRALELYPDNSNSIFDEGPPHPKVAPMQVGRGDALSALGRHKDAAASYEAAIATRKLTIERIEGEKRRERDARWPLPTDEPDDGAPGGEGATGPIPGHAEALHRHAMAILEMGEFNDAVAACERSIGINPDYAPAHRTLVTALLMLGRSGRPLDDLLPVIDRAIGVDPGYAPAHVARGAELCELGCPAYALAEYDRAIELDPGSAGAHHARGTALSELGRHAEALEALGRALEIDPALPGASLDKSRALSALGRHEEALAACDRALAARPGAHAEDGRPVAAPDSPRFHAARGLALDGLGRHDEARLAFERAAKLGPGDDAAHLAGPHAEPPDAATFRDDDPVAHRARAMTLESLGHHDEALAAYDRAIELDPDHAMAHRDRASVLLSLGRPVDALAALDRAAELRPGDPEFHARRADVLGSLGLHPEAKEARERAESPGYS